MQEKKYSAIRFKQAVEGDWVVFFSANAIEIEQWAGIPEKKNFDAVESLGFQRSFKDNRLESLLNFYSSGRNVLQNPILCAPRRIDQAEDSLCFVPDEQEETNAHVQKGMVVIRFKDFASESIKSLLITFQMQLEGRVPDLREQEVDDALLRRLKERYAAMGGEGNSEPVAEELEEVDQPESTVSEIESSHINDLWQEVACRIALIEEIGDQNFPDEILGFKKESIISYLKPVIIVDGQHRLIGATEHARRELDTKESIVQIEGLIATGVDEKEAKDAVLSEKCRSLPISMIFSADPAEHVFQFVVVNQKAMPISNALLGTIVSTSLSNNELERVAERLKQADIPLDASHAVSFVTRHPTSPFYNLVQTGIAGEHSGKLPWTVMKSIVSIFKDLRGGRLFGSEVKVDYADLWKRRFLIESEIVFADNKFVGWSADDGAWRDVFISFWMAIRDKFANSDDPESPNFWGNTSSNIFNKVSLTILAADFFKFLCDSKKRLQDASDIPGLVEDWLEGVDSLYFGRDWQLSNVKKDSPGIRKQWANLWSNYRQDPRKLPSIPSYRKSHSN
jgi:hypothetical protein